MKLTQKTIRQIIKEELESVLQETQLSDEITYKQLNGLLELAAGIKSNASREALKGVAKAADLSNDIISLVGGVLGISERKQRINEVALTIAAVIGGIKALVGAKAVHDFGKKAYNNYKGQPTDATDKMPLLDIFNLDERY